MVPSFCCLIVFIFFQVQLWVYFRNMYSRTFKEKAFVSWKVKLFWITFLEIFWPAEHKSLRLRKAAFEMQHHSNVPLMSALQQFLVFSEKICKWLLMPCWIFSEWCKCWQLLMQTLTRHFYMNRKTFALGSKILSPDSMIKTLSHTLTLIRSQTLAFSKGWSRTAVYV